MKRKYIFLTAIMFLLAFGTLFFKEANTPEQLEPQQLLEEIVRSGRYVTTDQVAKMIIQNNPSLEIIDVRNENEFNNYSLPKAINIPLDSLLNKNNLLYFGIPDIKVVFISNDAIAADQAWVFIKRLGFNNTFVMKGGLNHWMETIIEPPVPDQTEPATAFDTYAFRQGARMYFTGGKAEISEPSKINVQVRKRKKTNVVAGGC